jgi:peptidylprolyl isomerase
MVRMSRLALLLAVAVVAGAADAPPPGVVANRGSLQLTTTEVRDALSLLDPGQRDQLMGNPQALTNFVRERLLREVLLSEAREAAWDKNPAVVARMNDAHDTVLVQTWLASRVQLDPAYPSDAELTTAYDANKARFEVPKQYHIAQIAILVPANATKDVDDEAKRKARDVRAQVMKPKADFAAIARHVSQDKGSAERGGEFGWVREDQVTPAVRAVLPGMADNAISEPVRGPDAWHVVKLLGTRPPSVLPLEQVKAGLVNAMRQARTQQLAKAYVDGLLQKEPAQIEDVGLAERLSAPK